MAGFLGSARYLSVLWLYEDGRYFVMLLEIALPYHRLEVCVPAERKVVLYVHNIQGGGHDLGPIHMAKQ